MRNLVHELRNLTLLAGLAFAAEGLAYAQSAQPDIVFADFEGRDYGTWTATGKAFGSGPARGTLPNQMAVDGFRGKGLVNSFLKGDGSTGTLTSPKFTVNRRYIAFLIGGGGTPGKTCMNLLMGSNVVRTAVGPNTQPGGSERLQPESWEVSEFSGKAARIQIVDAATGGWGHINVDHIVFTDRKPPQTLTNASRGLVAEKRYLHLPVKNGAPKRFVTLFVDGVKTQEFDIELAEAQPDWWAFVDIAGYKGRKVEVQVDRLSEDSEALKSIEQGDALKGAEGLYREAWRPQYHFTSRRGWHNDPNGLVYYRGEWHLFYQHNPFGVNWGNMHWGSAVSSNLLHWREQGDVLFPDALGTMFSGSAVVDWQNTAGFQRGDEKPLVLIYTAAGGTSPWSKEQPFTQCLAYSNDRGRSWTKYTGNPVLKNITGGNRDPKVFWYEPTKRWVMALYVEVRMLREGKAANVHTIQFFGSPNLKDWAFLSQLDGYFECPDMFKLAVDGQSQNTRWVVFGADGAYQIGRFDGREFKAETDKLPGHHGAHFYAAQTYSDAPDGRRVLIGWMNGGRYPGMPFNQQMAIPMELTLRTTPAGIRLFKWPVSELAALRTSEHAVERASVPAGDPVVREAGGELSDWEAEFNPGDAAVVGFEVRGVRLRWIAATQRLECLGKSTELPAIAGRVRLRVVVDRTSLEIFGNEGAVYMSFCFLPKPEDTYLSCFAEGGAARNLKLQLRELKSVWPPPEVAAR